MYFGSYILYLSLVMTDTLVIFICGIYYSNLMWNYSNQIAIHFEFVSNRNFTICTSFMNTCISRLAFVVDKRLCQPSTSPCAQCIAMGRKANARKWKNMLSNTERRPDSRVTGFVYFRGTKGMHSLLSLETKINDVTGGKTIGLFLSVNASTARSLTCLLNVVCLVWNGV